MDACADRTGLQAAGRLHRIRSFRSLDSPHRDSPQMPILDVNLSTTRPHG